MVHIKRNSMHCSGDRLYLRPITLSDATREYVGWLNSEKVNQFLESRFVKHNLLSLRNYIKKISKEKNTFFFAIIVKDGNKHIGNIKLGPIDWHHKIADIGIMIGDKKFWGKGYATEAIELITNFAFETLKLHKITAGAYENNIGSVRAFLKAGFFNDGYRQKHFQFKKNYVGYVMLGKINN